MSKFAVIIFGDQAKANEASRVLTELQADNSLVLFSQAVIAKDLAGTVSLMAPASGGAVGSAVSGLASRLIGVPVGGHGGLSDAGVLDSFCQEAADALKPGATAIVAEISEDRLGPLNTQMHALGGQVLQSCNGYSEGDEIAKLTGRQIANIERLNAEYVRAPQDADKPGETPVDAVTLAPDERASNQSIVKANAEARSAKLSRACGLTKDALG